MDFKRTSATVRWAWRRAQRQRVEADMQREIEGDQEEGREAERRWWGRGERKQKKISMNSCVLGAMA